MKILNFGSCNIDYVYSLDHIAKPGETENAGGLEIFPGGKGLNQSIAAARAGMKIYHAGCVGCDGDILTDIMSQNNVDISYIKKTKQKNGHAIIQVSAEAENTIIIFAGSNEMTDKEYIDSVLKDFGKGDIILLQNEIANIDYIAKQAYNKGMVVMLNPSPFNEKTAKIDLNKIDYLVLNEIEIKQLSGIEAHDEAAEYLKNKYPNLKIMLTLGKAGCMYTDKNETVYQSAFKVDAVDTTAAGDTFTGYFAAGISRGEDIKSVLRFASAAAAMAVMKKGAAPSVPKRDEVSQMIGSLENYQNAAKLEICKSKIESYVEKNIKTASLSELAQLLSYSSVYTGSLVKKIFAVPFTKYLQQKRCDAAKDMLLKTDLPVCEIINRIGYDNESFFRKIFKSCCGENPLEYRKRREKKYE